MLIPVAVVSETAEPSVVAPAVGGYDLWLDASDPTSVVVNADGLHVDTWQDKSGNAYHATSTGTIPYVTGRLNGRRMMMMMGNQHLTCSAPWAGDSTSSAFFVGDLWNLAAYRTMICGTSNGFLQWIFNVSTMELFHAGVTGIASKSNGGITEALPFIAGVCVSAATTQYLKTRGASSTQETDGTATATGAVNLYIGRSIGSPYYFNGLIGEVITYPTTLSDADALSVIAGLSAKWDI